MNVIYRQPTRPECKSEEEGAPTENIFVRTRKPLIVEEEKEEKLRNERLFVMIMRNSISNTRSDKPSKTNALMVCLSS